MVKVALLGATGRFGTAIQELALAEFGSKLAFVAKIHRANAAEFQRVLSNGNADVILDVSLPEGSSSFLDAALSSNAKIPYVLGVTGGDSGLRKKLEQLSKSTAVLSAPNFSVGVNLLLNLSALAAQTLAPWGFQAAIHETHHAGKKDAPSGTARAILEQLSSLKSEVPVKSSRIGEVPGTHELKFSGPGEILTLQHEALDRTPFARGALMTSCWLSQQKPGVYNMKDFLFPN